MANTGKAYEKLTQAIFSQIVNQNAVDTITVEHDVDLQGRTTKHQIDVYWEFELGGVRYRTVVQCKDWRSPVDQGELLKLKGVLDDLPEQPRGIFVTRTGYQSGAREFADAHGIALYRLREPIPGEYLKTVVLRLQLLVPRVRFSKVWVDEPWYQAERERLGFEGEPRHARAVLSEFEDAGGRAVLTVNDLVNRLVKQKQGDEEELVHHEFQEHTFIRSGDSAFPRLKVLGIDFLIGFSRTTEQRCLELPAVPAFIVHNLANGSDVVFDSELQLIGSGD